MATGRMFRTAKPLRATSDCATPSFAIMAQPFVIRFLDKP